MAMIEYMELREVMFLRSELLCRKILVTTQMSVVGIQMMIIQDILLISMVMVKMI